MGWTGWGLSEEGDVWRELVSAQDTGLHYYCATVLVCLRTVCLGTGGSPDGLFVSVSSLRMWSALMYESYRPSPWRAGKKKYKQSSVIIWNNQICNKDTVRDKGWENTQSRNLICFAEADNLPMARARQSTIDCSINQPNKWLETKTKMWPA